MTTGYEVEMYRDIGLIRADMNRIAKALETVAASLVQLHETIAAEQEELDEPGQA